MPVVQVYLAGIVYQQHVLPCNAPATELLHPSNDGRNTYLVIVQQSVVTHPFRLILRELIDDRPALLQHIP